jgi:tRNA A-37 threonylcarbamoyl transferase component Bud32
MPAPTNADELLDLVLKSNLVEESRLRPYAQKLRDAGSMPADPAKLAQFLVRDALLTYFQAEQLLQGKYKRFSLGKYKVLERLGSGGMGTVFLCEHKLMRRRVAVKVLPIPKSGDEASIKRFYREAKAVAALDHPNIVRAYDLDQDDNLHFLVMEWVDGTNLHDLVKKFGPLDVARACHYVYGAAVGLQHAHEIGLVHRDIKPGNILIDRSGVVKILDLGLARLTHDTEDNLTRQNDENVLGTADYLAPEQAMDSHTVDIRADIYSLGATFYFLLTASPPFPEGSVAQKLIWHQNRQPRPVQSLRPEVPDELAAVVERMMAKEPAKRYATPAEVMAALAPWVAAPIPPPAEREMPALSPAVAGGAAAGRGGPAAAPSAVAPGVPTMGLLRPSAASTTLSGMPTAVASGSHEKPAAPAAEEEPAVWSSLDGETQSVARGDTGRPPPKREELPDEAEERPSRVARRQQAKAGKWKVALVALGGVALLAATAGGGWLIVSKLAGKREPQPHAGPQPQQPAGAHRITVSKAGGEGTARTLREAINRAGEGWTIAIAEPRLSEPALVLKDSKYKDLTIESATPDGKPAVIEYAGVKGGTVLDLSTVEGLRLRNVEFDGKGSAEVGVQVSGVCPGTTLEGVTVRGVQKVGFRLWNAAGAAGRSLTLDRPRVVLPNGAEAGVLSMATGSLQNKFIAIKGGRFEGSGGGSGVRLDGPAHDLDLSNNRFFHLGAAVSFHRPDGGARFTNNTVYQVHVGLQFDVPGPEPKGPVHPLHYDLHVKFNYFAHTPELLKCPVPIEGLIAEDNRHDPNSGLGNFPPSGAAKLDSPTLPKPDPADDAHFLHFPPNAAPTAGPNRGRVGVQ